MGVGTRRSAAIALLCQQITPRPQWVGLRPLPTTHPNAGLRQLQVLHKSGSLMDVVTQFGLLQSSNMAPRQLACMLAIVVDKQCREGRVDGTVPLHHGLKDSMQLLERHRGVLSDALTGTDTAANHAARRPFHSLMRGCGHHGDVDGLLRALELLSKCSGEAIHHHDTLHVAAEALLDRPYRTTMGRHLGRRSGRRPGRFWDPVPILVSDPDAVVRSAGTETRRTEQHKHVGVNDDTDMRDCEHVALALTLLEATPTDGALVPSSRQWHKRLIDRAVGAAFSLQGAGALMERALGLFRRASEIRPDTATYAAMVRGCRTMDDLRMVRRWAQDNTIEADRHVREATVRICLQRERPQALKGLVPCFPRSQTYATLEKRVPRNQLHRLAFARKLGSLLHPRLVNTELFDVFQSGVAPMCGLRGDGQLELSPTTIDALVRRFATHGKELMAAQLCEMARGAKVDLSQEAVGKTALAIASARGRLELKAFWHKTGRRMLRGDAKRRWKAIAWARCGEPTPALQLVRDGKYALPRQTLTLIMQAFAMHRLSDEALKVWDTLFRSGRAILLHPEHLVAAISALGNNESDTLTAARIVGDGVLLQSKNLKSWREGTTTYTLLSQVVRKRLHDAVMRGIDVPFADSPFGS